MKRYVILNKHSIEAIDQMFWSKRWGWGELTDADKFSDEERSSLPLLSGVWVELPVSHIAEMEKAR